MFETSPFNDNHICLTGNVAPVRDFENRFLAIDTSYKSICMILYDSKMGILDSMECQSHEIYIVMRFIDSICQEDPCIRIVGSILSRWPINLEKAICKSGKKIEWLSCELIKNVDRVIVHWDKKRRFHRAGLFAYLASSKFPVDYHTVRKFVLSWEAFMAREIIDEVNSELGPEGYFDEFREIF